MPINSSSLVRRTSAQKSKSKMSTESHGEETSKPTWLHLMDKDDLETQIKHKEIKQVFERESIFGAQLLELKTILKIQQENDMLAKEKWPQATMADFDVQVDQVGDPERGSNVGRNSDDDKKLEPKKWHIKDDILCFNNWQYILPRLLHCELLKLYHNNIWAGHFRYEQMLELLQCNYYWHNIATNMKEYVKSYSACRCHDPDIGNFRSQ